jgi:SAM-dependent methyltransferase
VLPWLFTVARALRIAAVAMILVSGPAAEAIGQTKLFGKAAGPSLRAADLFALKERCGSADPLEESLPLTGKHAFGGPEFKTAEIRAFEENRFFIYAVGVVSDADGGGEAGRRRKKSPRLVRRFIFLKPSTFVVDDQVLGPASKAPVRWLLHALDEPKIEDRRVRISGAEGELLCETLLPAKVTLESTRRIRGGEPSEDYRIEVVPQGDSDEVRFLHVIHTRSRGDEGSAARSELVDNDGRLQLTVSAGGRVFRLFLPSRRTGTDQIEVTGTDGQVLLPRRLLPAGVLPHGPEGTRLLERWDSRYRGDGRPAWDIGRPSSELKKAVEEGTLKPCRAVVLGCGTGTNAVYLAAKGFDVTGIDIAPTALSRAREKARKAGVKVRFLLADVLAPPELGPFELIYDRGCYHGVRRQNAAGYVKTVQRLTGPGSRILLLAGNANEERHYGPPRVKEEELRGDFTESFQFEWLREIRFDTMDPKGKGALAWSVLLQRKKGP